MSTGYEFNNSENEIIGSLAGKMSLVGTVNVIFGVLYLLSAVLVTVVIFQDELPPEVAAEIPEDVRTEIPGVNFLWGVALQLAVVGLIFLFIGLWTRTASSSFREIVATTGRDISHLMTALGALRKMYSLMYTIIILTLLVAVVGVGLQLYMRYGM